ncbi:putative uncharacterized protein PncC [Streptococcus pneumoniae INV104]|nr:putative uncharacterized protein PncC [Streptococcus pneumoniae ATCC 700669]CBW32153.1 putative uncharacterized protein PncC [Streptococcus pneumoniae OXC141]CBW36133.1 putative uncharacterized protein PncC [Streptococcus pneumoniae INV104]CCP30221.1 putative uncharacterized protein PncC [Streptococcus pneumoniae SPN994038]CCP32207.1 putative uncharacterized protein PncC [Streptococcus pneumoniae SPN034183]CCP34180.1 putative uncharacterized protein PncC [Streptococcus pneumoniae SPN994039]
MVGIKNLTINYYLLIFFAFCKLINSIVKLFIARRITKLRYFRYSRLLKS